MGTHASQKRMRMQPLHGDGFEPPPQESPLLTLRRPVRSFEFHYDTGIQPILFRGLKRPRERLRVVSVRRHICMKQVQCSHDVTIHKESRVAETTPSFPEFVLDECAAHGIVLRGFELSRIHQNHLRSSALSRSSKSFNEFRGGPAQHGFPVAASLEGLPVVFLHSKGTGQTHKNANESAMNVLTRLHISAL